MRARPSQREGCRLSRSGLDLLEEMNNACWSEMLQKERKWNAIDLAESRDERRARTASRIQVKPVYAKLHASATESTLYSYMPAPPHRFVPVTDGSVAPKPELKPRDRPLGSVSAVGGKLPHMIWPQDMSIRRLKPHEREAFAQRAGSAAPEGATRTRATTMDEGEDPILLSPTLGPLSPLQILRTPAMIANPSASGGIKMMWPHDMRW